MRKRFDPHKWAIFMKNHLKFNRTPVLKTSAWSSGRSDLKMALISNFRQNLWNRWYVEKHFMIVSYENVFWDFNNNVKDYSHNKDVI